MGEPSNGLGELVRNQTKENMPITKQFGRADYMQGTRMTFRSKEDAIHFAEKQGISSFLNRNFTLTRLIFYRKDGIIMCESFSSSPRNQEFSTYST